MFSRRKFLKRSVLGSLTLPFGATALHSCSENAEGRAPAKNEGSLPLVVSTWKNIPANTAAWEVIEKGGRALDAVEQGVRVPEADPKDSSVGFGGLPDREGRVTLDACIMDEMGNAGSVCFLQHIMHPVSVARKVMEETPHVILAGDGALQFALSQGFEKVDLLTDAAREHWEKWKVKSKYQPVINIENHDTIGMLAIDENGDISGACTTSGLAYKIHGRVGDSPIIGAGMFVDNEIGGAVATGMGEAVLKTLGSFLVVELMRQGKKPQEACEEAIMRIVEKQDHEEFQIGYLAVNKAGERGAYSIHSGFSYSFSHDGDTKVVDSGSFLKTKAGSE